MKQQLTLIQILRGLAALSVLLFHVDADALNYLGTEFFHFDYGYLGVDFFFVLSGFIITYIHFKDIGKKEKVLPFAKKRFIRIYPFYWLVLLAYVIVAAPEFTHKPTLMNFVRLHSVESWTVVIKNILLLPLLPSKMPLGVAWSLTYELLFYGAFGLAIISGWKWARVILFGWLAVIIINAAYTLPIPSTLTNPMIVEFMFGVLAGYIVVKGKWQITATQLLIGLAAIAGGFIAYLSTHLFDRENIILTTLIGAAAGLIILFTVNIEQKHEFLAAPILVLIGNASYAVYLTHSIFSAYLFDFLSTVFNLTVTPAWFNWVAVISVTLLTIILGILAHLLIEKPVLTFLQERFTGKKRFALSH